MILKRSAGDIPRQAELVVGSLVSWAADFALMLGVAAGWALLCGKITC